MAVSFNHHDKASWYFGAMPRQDAHDLLMAEGEGGVFLVRDSTSIEGDYVLCVKEDNKVSHYIINKIRQGEQARYKIGDQMFNDLPSLLNFYKVHYLDTTPLIRPAMKKVEKVVAKYDFDGKDPDDLPFRKGDVMTVVSKDEEQWWTARNSLGQTGSIPVPYIAKLDEKSLPSSHHSDQHQPVSSHLDDSVSSKNSSSIENLPNNLSFSYPASTGSSEVNRPNNAKSQLPVYARVTLSKVPNAYDKTALRLEVGDTIKILERNVNGLWKGELHGKVGYFPFTHVDIIDDDSGGGGGGNPGGGVES